MLPSLATKGISAMARSSPSTRSRLLTVAEVAAWLNLTERQVRDRVTRDTIPHLHAGKSVRFDPAEIEAWLRARREAVA